MGSAVTTAFTFFVFNFRLELFILSTKCLRLTINYSKHCTVTQSYNEQVTCLGMLRQWLRKELLTLSSFKATVIHLILK